MRAGSINIPAPQLLFGVYVYDLYRYLKLSLTNTAVSCRVVVIPFTSSLNYVSWQPGRNCALYTAYTPWPNESSHASLSYTYIRHSTPLLSLAHT